MACSEGLRRRDDKVSNISDNSGSISPVKFVTHKVEMSVFEKRVLRGRVLGMQQGLAEVPACPIRSARRRLHPDSLLGEQVRILLRFIVCALALLR